MFMVSCFEKSLRMTYIPSSARKQMPVAVSLTIRLTINYLKKHRCCYYFANKIASPVSVLEQSKTSIQKSFCGKSSHKWPIDQKGPNHFISIKAAELNRESNQGALIMTTYIESKN
jgi:hypothetical protein